jgi:tRNA (guanine-N7-)-methyltransferase
MGGRKVKKQKIAAIAGFENVYQHHAFDDAMIETSSGEKIDPKGQWNKLIFKNENPITLELACGKGEYTVNLAKAYPNRNFIGVDLKGPRIFTGAKIALEEGLKNVAFLRMKIENIAQFFAENEVAEIWITFPDPYPKEKHEKHRLTHPLFLKRYKKILQPNAIIQLKTDDLGIFRFTKEVIDNEKLNLHYYKEDIYAAPLDFDFLTIKTYYESKFLVENKPINYLRFSLP